MEKKNIVLCGFMGSGKTTVGRLLGKLSGMNYVDLDRYIEKKYDTTIKKIFEEHGEDYFRDLEYEVTKELAQKHHHIIASGGGTLLFERNVEILKKNCVVVLLNVPLGTIKYRLRNDKKRPLLQRPDKEKVMEELYNARLPLYRKSADYVVNANKSPYAIVHDIMDLVLK